MKQFPVKLEQGEFIVETPTKNVYFQQSSSGLFYHDTENRKTSLVNAVVGKPFELYSTVSAIMVEGNKLGLTAREVKKADDAKRQYIMCSEVSKGS